MRLFRSLAVLLPVFCLGSLSSCETARFYAQAVRGQMDILDRARPVAAVAVDPGTPASLHRKLELVGELRGFARDGLRLPVKRQFSTYADLGRPYAVYNLHAAPEFSIEARTWWYPFVGRAKYRGYFSEKPARVAMAKLAGEGFDVYLGGVRVYSTLGWFADPVLNTFIGDEPAGLAETVFHELSHARVFVGGDSDFNEAFATANAQEGVRRWLWSRGDAAGVARYERGLERDRRILELLMRTRDELAALYERSASSPAGERRVLKARVFAKAKAEYAAMRSRSEVDHVRDIWFERQFNNARLAAIATYHDLVPGFAALLRAQGGDLERFYAAVARMRSMDRERRREMLLGLTAPGSAGSARS